MRDGSLSFENKFALSAVWNSALFGTSRRPGLGALGTQRSSDLSAVEPFGLRDPLPCMEAFPVELLRGADLIGEAKKIRVPLLLGAPAAAPAEFEHVRIGVRLRFHRAGEIRAARNTGYRDSLNRELRLRRQDLLQQALNFDRRQVRLDLNPGRLPLGAKCAHIGLEGLVRARLRQQFFQLLQRLLLSRLGVGSRSSVNKYRLVGRLSVPHHERFSSFAARSAAV